MLQSTDVEASPKKRPRILYVEDDNVSWLITAEYLSEKFDVLRAQTSQEAFEILANDEFNIILVDIHLKNSDLDGMEIVKVLSGKAVKNAPDYTQHVSAHNAHILFVTAHTSCYPEYELVQAGGHGIISKPVDLSQITQTFLELSITQDQHRHNDEQFTLSVAAERSKRKNLRYRLPVDLDTSLAFNNQKLHVDLEDISFGGLRLRIPAANNQATPPLKTKCQVHIKTPWGKFQANATVLRTITSTTDLGLLFDDLSPESLQLLKKWFNKDAKPPCCE